MQAFNSELFLTTSEAADLLDVHPSTVKRWTDAGELESDKTDGGHRRIYLREVLEFANGRGVQTYLAPFTPFESHVWLAVQDAIRHDDYSRTVSLAMGWLVRGYPRRISALFQDLGSRKELAFARVCDGGIQPFMEEVGMAWREGRLRIGEEHIASQAVLEALVRLSDEAWAGIAPDDDLPTARPAAVVGSMEGNRHHIGAMCVRILLERAGWTVHYLGADTPPEEFAAIQRARGAELVCVSFSPPTSIGHMRRCLDVLREFYRPASPFDLVFGGAGTDELDGGTDLPFRSFLTFPSAESFIDWAHGRGQAATGARSA